MTAIRHTLQRDVFLPSDEKLVGVVHVTKAGKRKKSSFLCAVVTTDNPTQAYVYKVKKSDRGDTYKKRQQWLLRNLKLVDGKDAAKECGDFDLHFDKNYKWVATNASEKNSFITSLWKLCQRYLSRKKPDFVNVNLLLLEFDAVSVGSSGSTVSHQETTSADLEDYQVLSEREKSDLERMMTECSYSITNAEAFTEQLTTDLLELDGANIQAIMCSEQQVDGLMSLFDKALQEVDKIETQLNGYEKILSGVKCHMELMEDKDRLMKVQHSNEEKLLHQLNELVEKLDFPEQYIDALEGDLSSPYKIQECTAAAKKLQQCMDEHIHPCLYKLRGVTEQKKLFENLRKTFAIRLSKHLNNFFIKMGLDGGRGTGAMTYTHELTMPKHHNSHRDLAPYTELMLWLRQADYASFMQIAKVYVSSLSKLYDREIKEFFESARMRLQGKSFLDAKRHGLSASRLTGSISDLSKTKARSGSLVDSLQGSQIDISLEKYRFDKIFEQVMTELEPAVTSEQEFCTMFFHLSHDPSELDFMDLSFSSNEVEFDEDTLDGAAFAKKKNLESENMVYEKLRRMMGELYSTLEQELLSFIAFSDKLDPLNTMYMLVRISLYVSSTNYKFTQSSFLSIVLGSCLVIVKRNFDKNVKSLIQEVKETKVSKKSRCGIVSFVTQFKEFSTQAEHIFQGAERRIDLDKAYKSLIETVFHSLQRLSVEHQKTPAPVILFENYHHLQATLSELKITCLEDERKDAKLKYQEHLQDYITTFLGHPLEKLNHFFEGLQAKVAQGVKEDEVGYQLAFSKQELRKVIKEYPGKEVKKGLENLYRKVEKHLCEEENLLQVVWHIMQDEFIRQYKHYEELIQKCYPGSKISMEFTIADILDYFSNIAQSH